MEAKLLHHLRNADDIVVATTDEADKGFPGILLQDPHAGEFGGFLLEVRVCAGPLLV